MINDSLPHLETEISNQIEKQRSLSTDEYTPLKMFKWLTENYYTQTNKIQMDYTVYWMKDDRLEKIPIIDYFSQEELDQINSSSSLEKAVLLKDKLSIKTGN